MRKDVVGYEGLYQVDEDGNVWSLKYNKCKKRKLGKDKVGYLHIDLWKNGKPTMFKVHRLVALSFIPNPENKPQVNHINGIKTDNRVQNLEWVTQSENQFHAYKNGLQVALKGENHGSTKHPDSVVRKIFQMRKEGYLLKEIAEETGYSFQHVSSILNGKRRK